MAEKKAPKRTKFRGRLLKGDNGLPCDNRLARLIMLRVIAGDTLATIGRLEGFPTPRTLYIWVAKSQAFRELYEAAKLQACERVEDEIREISDDTSNDTLKRLLEDGTEIETPNPVAISRAKLRADNRKWWLEKTMPKKYGNLQRQEISGPNGGAINVTCDLPDSLKELLGRLSGE